MGCMVSPEQGQRSLLCPTVLVQVPAPVLVPDTASMTTFDTFKSFTFDTFRRGEEEMILGKYGVDNLNGALRVVSEQQYKTYKSQYRRCLSGKITEKTT